MFNRGDKVKLKDYTIHTDYQRHCGEIGIICDHIYRLDHSSFNYKILWSDGDISNALAGNIKLHIREWDDEKNI